MITTHPRRSPTPTTVSLRRWLCTSLAVWIALQATSSALLELQGVWHRHRPAASASAPAMASLALRWQHGGTVAAHDRAHARLHDDGVVHRHAATDDSVWTLADQAASDAIGHLASTLAGGTEMRWRLRVDARHVRGDAPAWSATMRAIPPLLRPPRA